MQYNKIAEVKIFGHYCKETCEYEIFNKTQKITSDFDKEVKKIMGKKDDTSQN